MNLNIVSIANNVVIICTIPLFSLTYISDHLSRTIKEEEEEEEGEEEEEEEEALANSERLMDCEERANSRRRGHRRIPSWDGSVRCCSQSDSAH